MSAVVRSLRQTPSLARNEVKKLEVVQAQRRLATHGVSEISVNQPEITGPGTAKNAARKLRLAASTTCDTLPPG